VLDLPLPDRPFVEGLVHDQKTQPVAQIKKLGRGRVVRGANGIAAHVLQQVQPPDPHALGDRRAHRTAVVVQAHALELHWLVVEEKTAINVKSDAADPNRRLVGINDLASSLHATAHSIEIRRVRRPQPRMRYGDRLIELPFAIGR